MDEIKRSSNRSFGFVFSIVFVLIAIYPLLKNEDLRVWSLLVSVVFFILGLLKSKLLTPLNKTWFKFGLFLGKIVSPVIMGIIFFLVVTPTAFLMKILKKDLLNLNYNDDKSYWMEKTGPKSKMKNQF
jgi:hypothetical protein